jgi:hypothetical protein
MKAAPKASVEDSPQSQCELHTAESPISQITKRRPATVGTLDGGPCELWISPGGADPLAATLSRVIQGGPGGNDGGRLQHPGWPGGWQKSSPLTPNTRSRHQQLNRYRPRAAVGPPPLGI